MNYLKGIGCHVIKTQVNTTSGEPDILACYQGTFIGLEVKRPGNEPTALQRVKLASINRAGGLGFWADCVEDVKSHLMGDKSKVISKADSDEELLDLG